MAGPDSLISDSSECSGLPRLVYAPRVPRHPDDAAAGVPVDLMQGEEVMWRCARAMPVVHIIGHRTTGAR